MAPVTYCISGDNQKCYNDLGSLCNFTGNGSAWCNIYNNTNSCPTRDGTNCYNTWVGLYMTYDGNYTSPIIKNKLGTYCYSVDGN